MSPPRKPVTSSRRVVDRKAHGFGERHHHADQKSADQVGGKRAERQVADHGIRRAATVPSESTRPLPRRHRRRRNSSRACSALFRALDSGGPGRITGRERFLSASPPVARKHAPGWRGHRRPPPECRLEEGGQCTTTECVLACALTLLLAACGKSTSPVHVGSTAPRPTVLQPARRGGPETPAGERTTNPGEWMAPGPHLRRAALQPAQPDQRFEREPARARLVLRSQHASGHRVVAALHRRRDLQHQRVEHHLRDRRPDRQGAVEIRPAGRSHARPVSCAATS